MRFTRPLLWPACTAAALLAACSSVPSGGGHPMSFFITSANPGQGGNLGGLAGADAQCQRLAGGVGAGGRTWRAYLSTTAAARPPARNPPPPNGPRPGGNPKGGEVCTTVGAQHTAGARLGKDTSLTEKGEAVPGYGDAVNRHDILTGSRPDGTVAVPEPGKDTTCGNWTRGEGGSAIVGHHDLKGLNPDPVANASWNASHGTRGCSLPQLAQSGSAGLMYCFVK